MNTFLDNLCVGRYSAGSLNTAELQSIITTSNLFQAHEKLKQQKRSALFEANAGIPLFWITLQNCISQTRAVSDPFQF